MAERQNKRTWRDYSAAFSGAGNTKKDLHITVLGPNAGSHFAGEWTLDEAVEFATDILSEVDRRKQDR